MATPSSSLCSSFASLRTASIGHPRDITSSTPRWCFLLLQMALPEIAQKITWLENEDTLLDSSGETDLAEHHKLGLDISEPEKKIIYEMMRPERTLLYLVPGRLVVGFTKLHMFFPLTVFHVAGKKVSKVHKIQWLVNP
ncbi:hypothetical protein ZEAMMB73_Zm00001d044733 [Zea mays]|uniref:Uncharacterized protein n=1 Tax=Zea mays TaxID=4577 RepID=A0A1D6NR03_MAIZE|nr:hypothetical protein ZEAMMB73_Zm00001d044733 [Zea mays]